MNELTTALAGHITGEAKQEALRQILADPRTLKEMAAKHTTSPDLLDSLARQGGRPARLIVAENIKASEETLDYLISLKEKDVSEAAQHTLNYLKGQTSEAITLDPGEHPTAALIEYTHYNKSTTTPMFVKLAKGHLDNLRRKMAEKDETWEEDNEEALQEGVYAEDLLREAADYDFETSPKQWGPYVDSLFTGTVIDLYEGTQYEWGDETYKRLTEIRKTVTTLKTRGWTAKPAGARWEKLLNPDTSVEELKAIAAGLKKGDHKLLAANLTYVHPKADLEIEAAALAAAGADLPAGILIDGNQYGTKTHAQMIIEQIAVPGVTLELLGDVDKNWPKILGADYTARALGEAVNGSDEGGEELTGLMTFKVAKELIRACEEGLFYFLIDRYEEGEKLAVTASYNEKVAYKEASTLWGLVPANEVMNMSVPVLLGGLRDQYAPAEVGEKLQIALAGLGKAVGDSSKILLTVDGVGQTFKGSIKELGELAKEATAARRRDGETPAANAEEKKTRKTARRTTKTTEEQKTRAQ